MGRSRRSRLCSLLLAGLLGLTGGCSAPVRERVGGLDLPPALAADHARMPDGYRLPLRVVGPARGTPSVVALGLHGLNDYSRAFLPLAEGLAAVGVRSYLVDQRGFGASALAGRWHGEGRLVEDVALLTRLLRARYPRARLLIIGESMGAAVAMRAVTRERLPIDGLVLIAPAVWARETMPWYQRAALASLVRIAPELPLTGEGVPIYPSDNLPMLRAMGADPLVLKASRVSVLWGVANLMDGVLAGADRLPGPVLLLYGEQDQIIPPPAFCRLREQLQRKDGAVRLVLYRDGWHMLPRDCQGARVIADIATWVRDPSGPLPSGEEAALSANRLTAFCERSWARRPPPRANPGARGRCVGPAL